MRAPALVFLGAVDTVTGSRFLLDGAHRRVLVDAGLYQGLAEHRRRNWAGFPVDPAQIDETVLTHAHLDHTGYLPRLVKDGFAGRITCTRETAELATIVLRDSAHLQLEDAQYANAAGFSRHDPALPLYDPQDVERATVARGGSVLVPAFAVDRTELVLLELDRLAAEGAIPDVPVHVDSPMALASLAVYQRAAERGGPQFRAGAAGLVASFDAGSVRLARTVEESMRLNRPAEPCIVVSASGMATGGRVVHHLAHQLPDRRNTVVLTGYQAVGTRGRALLDGAREVKIHGRYVPVRAEVVSIPDFSVHSDADETLAWLARAPRPPRTVYVVHGEPAASAGLAARISQELGWVAVVPSFGERVLLG